MASLIYSFSITKHDKVVHHNLRHCPFSPVFSDKFACGQSSLNIYLSSFHEELPDQFSKLRPCDYVVILDVLFGLTI